MYLLKKMRSVALLLGSAIGLAAQVTDSSSQGAAAAADGNTLKKNVPLPSANQQRVLDIGLSMFIHYSVNPWVTPHKEHNCVGPHSKCVPASNFNPSHLSTDQWVEAAVAMGAGEICLTAHHEGGFCLWDTQYTDYNVMNSPYGKDIVKQFVASCKKYNVQPCYYMGPNANGYLNYEKQLNSEAFIEAQLGMLSELLTNYDLQPSRLWWDHYPHGCGGLSPCPNGSFPDAWIRFIDLVRARSPNTLICPGPDCDGHQGESGVGVYPTWNPCNQTVLECKPHAPSAQLSGFHPYEACATMVNKGNWFCQGDGSTQTFWTAGEIWDHYMKSVGVGWINTLNAPVCTTGQMAPILVQEMENFGTALRFLFNTVHASQKNIVGQTCSNTTLTTNKLVPDALFNAVILQEDLSKGQRITKYALDYYHKNKGEWVQFKKGVHGQSIGNLLIDWLDPQEVESAEIRHGIRLRCLEAMQVPVYLKSISLNTGFRPSDDESSSNNPVEDAVTLQLLDTAVV